MLDFPGHTVLPSAFPLFVPAVRSLTVDALIDPAPDLYRKPAHFFDARGLMNVGTLASIFDAGDFPLRERYVHSERVLSEPQLLAASAELFPRRRIKKRAFSRAFRSISCLRSRHGAHRISGLKRAPRENILRENILSENVLLTALEEALYVPIRSVAHSSSEAWSGGSKDTRT